jgi:hypothetical protein
MTSGGPRQKLAPFVVQHGLEPLPGYVARSGAVEVVADFLVVSGNGFGHRAGGASYYKEPARDTRHSPQSARPES